MFSIAAPPPPGRGVVVLQVLPRLVAGGAERGAIDVAGAVVAAGGAAIVASRGGPMVRELARLGAAHVELPLDSRNPIVMRANVGRLLRLIERHGVDIVHARSRAPAWSAYFAARRAGCRFVTTFHGAYTAGNWLKRRYNGVMAKGDRVIAVSDFIAGLLRSDYGVQADRLRIVPRGIDLELFDPERVSAERVIQLATRWRLPDGVPVVMLPARFTRLKGQHVLIEAVARLGGRDLRCLLIGPEPERPGYRREIEGLIARRRLGGRVHIVDDCRDMPAAYKLADVVVSASVAPEAFGRTIAEAQAMGRPVVASDHGGVREQAAIGRMVWLTPPGDAAALAAAIVRALDLSPEERERLAPEAIAAVRAHYAKDAMCADTLAVYRELLEAAPAPARAARAGETARPLATGP
ncbi:MAG TPA: glycosyltransferase family 4 protein [Dongiaceae bacterium]|nr:glycosyltransferase family 4 protein [Dongiaceae bacterium]